MGHGLVKLQKPVAMSGNLPGGGLDRKTAFMAADPGGPAGLYVDESFFFQCIQDIRYGPYADLIFFTETSAGRELMAGLELTVYDSVS